MTTPAIPAWQLADLGSLAQQGQLGGVDPLILAAQDQAESSGQGGGINSSGYGGWFGEGVGSAYPGGTPDAALLTSTSPQAFDAQAQIAASLDAALLNAHGGSTVAMEQAYQLGPNSPIVGTSTPTEGTQVFAQDGVPAVDPVGASANTAGFTIPAWLSPIGNLITGGGGQLPGGAADPLNWGGDIAGAIASLPADLGKVGSLLWADVKTWAITGLFLAGGIGMVVWGIRNLDDGGQQQPDRVGQLAALAPLVAA